MGVDKKKPGRGRIYDSITETIGESAMLYGMLYALEP